MSYKSEYFDDGDWFGGMYGKYDGYPGSSDRPHDHFLDIAKYAYWSKRDAIGYQYLADCYNKFVRKDDELPLASPPSHL